MLYKKKKSAFNAKCPPSFLNHQMLPISIPGNEKLEASNISNESVYWKDLVVLIIELLSIHFLFSITINVFVWSKSFLLLSLCGVSYCLLVAQFINPKLVFLHSLFLVRFVTLKHALTSFYQSFFCFEVNNFLLVLLGLLLQRKILSNIQLKFVKITVFFWALQELNLQFQVFKEISRSRMHMYYK